MTWTSKQFCGRSHEIKEFYQLNNNNMTNTGKALWYRFLRGAVAGAVSTGLTVTFVGGQTFANLQSFLSTLVVALIVGGISGFLLTLDKFIRMD